MAAIVIDSLFKSGKNYQPQTFLEECKYKIKEKERKPSIENDLESFDDEKNSESGNVSRLP